MVKAQNPLEDVDENSDSDYKDDDPVAEPTPVLLKDEVQAAFDDIAAKAHSGKLNLGQKESRTAFMEQYGDVLFMKTQAYSQTLLHVIASKVGHKSLTRFLVKHDKMLLWHKDESGKTALHIAIVGRNYNFLDVVLKEISNLDSLLRMTGEHARNCIHMAIYHGLGKGYTPKLIAKASEATLCATDQDGLTPLHLAVDYQRSTDAQLAVVQTLIAHGDGAFDKFTTNPKGLSVYEYHQYTRNLAKKVFVPKPVSNRGAERSLEEPLNVVVPGQKIDPMKSKREGAPDVGIEPSIFAVDLKRPERGQGMAPPAAANTSGRRGSIPTPGAANTMFDHFEDGEPHVKRSQLTVDSAGFEPQQLERRGTGFIAKGNRKEDENSRRLQEDEKRKTEYADKIREEFKLYYLRTTFRKDRSPRKRDQYKAIRFLHGANIENFNLCFDYSEAPTLILQESFRQSYDHMNFDDVLRYVTFRRIELQKPPPPTNRSKFSLHLPQKATSGNGRSDLTFFFKWLYNKNVRHILKVTVDDLKDPPHSDEAIEESLSPFKVETLDWRRVDLCPETLYNACQSVRVLYLRWSGNRAILRAWGEPDGLPRLEQLEQVHLVWNPDQTLESADRIERYIKDFQERLNQSLENIDTAQRNQEEQAPEDEETATKRKILVYKGEENAPNSEQLVQSGGPIKILSSTNERNLQSNRWLECMDKFADEIQNVQIPSIDNVSLKKDIKVALIDDGADPYVESLRGKIKGGESFDCGYPHENGPSPYYTSTNGHGTVMADMICRVCPMAKLYVYKLESHSSINPATQLQTHEQISAKSAALAVTAARNQKVDIISMSWTVKETEDNHHGISELREAIKEALDAGILLFCAAADTGAVTEVEYPWSYDQRRIFRIGAATADGRIWGPTGSPQSINFILPGHKVVSRNPHRAGALPDDFEERTGSSIATALAAGLAALILHCVRLGAIHTELEMRQGIPSSMAVKAAEFKLVRDHNNMNGVLKAIGLDEGQQKFIEVWKRFDGATQNLKSPNIHPNSKLGVVAKLARDFVSGIAGTS